MVQPLLRSQHRLGQLVRNLAAGDCSLVGRAIEAPKLIKLNKCQSGWISKLLSLCRTWPFKHCEFLRGRLPLVHWTTVNEHFTANFGNSNCTWVLRRTSAGPPTVDHLATGPNALAITPCSDVSSTACLNGHWQAEERNAWRNAEDLVQSTCTVSKSHRIGATKFPTSVVLWGKVVCWRWLCKRDFLTEQIMASVRKSALCGTNKFPTRLTSESWASLSHSPRIIHNEHRKTRFGQVSLLVPAQRRLDMHPRRHTRDIAKIGVRKFHRARTRVCSVRFLTRQTLSTDFMVCVSSEMTFQTLWIPQGSLTVGSLNHRQQTLHSKLWQFKLYLGFETHFRWPTHFWPSGHRTQCTCNYTLLWRKLYCMSQWPLASRRKECLTECWGPCAKHMYCQQIPPDRSNQVSNQCCVMRQGGLLALILQTRWFPHGPGSKTAHGKFSQVNT